LGDETWKFKDPRVEALYQHLALMGEVVAQSGSKVNECFFCDRAGFRSWAARIMVDSALALRDDAVLGLAGLRAAVVDWCQQVGALMDRKDRKSVKLPHDQDKLNAFLSRKLKR
jgi:hypothetical protein